MSTYRVQITGSWTLVADHQELIGGYISNDKSYHILVKSSTTLPDDSDYDGHIIQLEGRHFDLSNNENLYARMYQTGISPLNPTHVTISYPGISNAPALPYDLYTGMEIGSRRFKTSARDSKLDASYNGLLYSFSGSRLVPLSQKLGLNIIAAAPTIIHSIEISSDLNYSIYNAYATGTPDGVVDAQNLNLSSIDTTPATLQMIDNSTPAGDRLYWTSGDTIPAIIADENSELSISIENTTTGSVTIKYTIIFEEIGARAPFFGLTSSTFLEPDTEMSIYG